MTPPNALPVVLDCTVYVQALLNPRGPAGACIAAAQQARLRVFVNRHVITEIREIPSKVPARFGVTDERVARLIADLAKYAVAMEDVPEVFAYPRDPDDASYVNLAIASGAMLVASRDNDLLDLMDDRSAIE